MRYHIQFLFLICTCPAFAQEQVVEKDIVYGKAADLHGSVIELKFDIVYSTRTSKLPLVVFAHGGEFMESSSKEGLLPFCERLARNGFVVANIEYRRGFIPSLQQYRTELAKAVYRAEQDQLAVIRYLVHHATKYHIDTSMIIVGGESAGAVASLFSSYASQEDWNRFMPMLDSTLGDIGSSGNNLQDKFNLKGVIGMWGGIVDTAFISEADMQATPALLFHSVDDEMISFAHASHPKVKYQILQGSRDIADRFKNNSRCYQIYYVLEAGHGYGFSGDFLATSISNFVSSIRARKCNSLEAKNPERNITLGMLDSDDAAFPNEDDKIIKLSATDLQQYAGKYQAGNFVPTIVVEGDHLIEPGSDGTLNRLYPLGNNIFIQKNYNLRIEFIKDNQGKVTEQIVRLHKYKEYHFKKIE